MNMSLRIRLVTDEPQQAKLQELQQAFAAVCNALAPIVQRTRCWNRVALHHLAYRAMREQFPALGSQMVCNALYSVSRAARLVYQHPGSPFSLQRLAGKPLPRLLFLPQSPVYFDRHTLSLRNGQASMYTLDGRMRFNLPLGAADEQRFRQAKLREIVLLNTVEGYALNFVFADAGEEVDAKELAAAPGVTADFPDHLVVIEDLPAAALAAQPIDASHPGTTVPRADVLQTGI